MGLEIYNRKFEIDLAKVKDQQERLINTSATIKLPIKYDFFGIKCDKRMPAPFGWLMRKCPPTGRFCGEIELLEVKDKQGRILKTPTFETIPFECSLGGSNWGRTVDFDLNDSGEEKLYLTFDPSAILDCPDLLDKEREYQLHFKLSIKQNKKLFTSCEDFLELKVLPFIPSLIYEFIPKDICKRSGDEKTAHLKFHGDKDELEVGWLEVSHCSKLSCAPAIENIDFSLSVNTIKRTKQGEIFVDKKDELYDVLKFGGFPSDIVQQDEPAANRARVKCLKAGESRKIPIVMRMKDSVSNPLDKDYPDIFVPVVNHYEVKGKILLYRNELLTRLQVLVRLPKDDNTMYEKDITRNDEEQNIGELHLFAGFKKELTFEFSNLADTMDPLHPNAAVVVWGAKIGFEVDGEERLILKNSKTIGDVIKLSVFGEGNRLRDVQETDYWIIPANGHECLMKISIPYDVFDSVKPDPNKQQTFVVIKIVLNYNAMEDLDGAVQNQLKKEEPIEEHLFTRAFKFRLKLEPQREWLCVDFGTSAVVAAFASTGEITDKGLINLKSVKDEMIKATKEDTQKRKNDDEVEPFIASTVCFNRETSNDNQVYDFRTVFEKHEEYKHNTVLFSPWVSIMHSSAHLLPCLKTLMGYNYLPDIFSAEEAQNFEYKINGKNTHLKNQKGEYSDLMKVDEVFQLVYKQLFKLYLTQRYDNNVAVKRRIEKLVLSVPNTYTPLNLQTIKRLAREAIPEIHPEFLYTVSESDAVACYYISNRHIFQKSIENAERREQIKQRENVLVYDMGAGTLDLTYFVKTIDPSNPNKIQVEVKGKMGINKAGNYLDYLIASILVDICQDPKNKQSLAGDDDDIVNSFKNLLELDIDKATDNWVDPKDRQTLKNYVKRLKTNLDRRDKTLEKLKLSFGEIDFSQNKVSDILERTIDNKCVFDEFIEEITGGVLNNFAELFGEGERGNRTLDIDVLIFSGRSTSLKAIRSGVNMHIDEICQDLTKRVLYADICSEKLSENVEIQTLNNNKLKSVVTKGALAYTEYNKPNSVVAFTNSRTFFANFGAVVHKEGGAFDWIPLIGSEVETLSPCEGVIQSFEKDCSGIGVRRIDLVQSYSANVIEDYERGNLDAISKLAEVRRELWADKFKMQLTIYDQLKAQNPSSLKFEIMNGEADLNPHDDFNNLSLRKSLWPVIFSTNDRDN